MISRSYQLRKHSGFPIQANSDRKKASHVGRKKALSKFNKQTHGKQRSTTIEQNPQFENAEMNLVVEGRRIRLEFITKSVLILP